MKPKRLRRKWLKKRHLKAGMVVSLTSDYRLGLNYPRRRYTVLLVDKDAVASSIQIDKSGLYLFRGYMYVGRDFLNPNSYGKIHDIPRKGIQLVGHLSNTPADYDLICWL